MHALHLALTYSVGPSSIVWSELGPAPPFPPMRVLEVQWSHALKLVWEVALRLPLSIAPMNGYNRLLFTVQPNEFEKKMGDVPDFRRITHHCRGTYGIYPKLIKKNWKMSTCNRVALKTLGSSPNPVEIGQNPSVSKPNWLHLTMIFRFFFNKKNGRTMRLCPCLHKTTAGAGTLLLPVHGYLLYI